MPNLLEIIKTTLRHRVDYQLDSFEKCLDIEDAQPMYEEVIRKLHSYRTKVSDNKIIDTIKEVFERWETNLKDAS
jgi:hypothetical protein